MCLSPFQFFTIYLILSSVPPSIDEANLVDNPRVVLNRTILLECPVEGIPPPKVRWLKNGVPISSGKGITIKVWSPHLYYYIEL